LRHVIPLHCLGHLRFLELVFSPFADPSRPREDHPALLDWAETLDWAKNKLNLTALTLRIIMVRSREYQSNENQALQMTRAQGKQVLATYNRIIAPLERLGAATDNGLARFYAELEWLQSKRRELKTRAERGIMGERYDRVGSPAGEPHRSVWNQSCLNTYYN
jgi:hypothetical protein